jgi:hypothetical protein
MPFKSKAQQRLFFAKAQQPGSGITEDKAKEWAHETPNIKKLPEHVKKGKIEKRSSLDDVWQLIVDNSGNWRTRL